MDRWTTPGLFRGLVTVDRASGVSFAIFSLVVINELRSESSLAWWDRLGPGPTFVPYGLAAVLLILSVPLILSKRRDDPSSFGVSTPATVKYSALVTLLVLLFPVIGGLFALGLFVFVEVGWVERLGLRRAVLAAGATVGVVWAVMSMLLAVRFPTGLLGF